VRVKGDRIHLDYTDNNTAFDRLLTRWTEVLKSINCGDRFAVFTLFPKRILQGVAHQVGTCRFGNDPQTSVLDLTCRMM